MEDEEEGKILRRTNEKLPRTDLLIRDGLPDLYFSVKLSPRFSFKKIVRVKLDYIHVYIYICAFVVAKVRDWLAMENVKDKGRNRFNFSVPSRGISKNSQITNFARQFLLASAEKIFIKLVEETLSSVSHFSL